MRHVAELAPGIDVASVRGPVERGIRDEVRPLLGEPLDAERAVQIAVLNNRELRAKLRELGVTRGEWIEARLLPNPVVEIEALPERNSQVELRVEYNITEAVFAPLRARAAHPALLAARYSVAAEVIALGFEVRAAFYRVRAAAARVARGRQMLEGHAARRDATQAMSDAGNVPALDVATEEAAYERERVGVSRLELEAMTEREHLARLLGLERDVRWQSAGDLSPAPAAPRSLDDLETRALRTSLAMAQARQRIEHLARQADLTVAAGWIPEIAVDVHGLEGNPSDEDPDDSFRFGAGVSVEVPLFDRDQGTATALRAELQATMERAHGLGADLRSHAREVAHRVRSSHERARRYADVIIPAQRRVTEETLLQYNAMQIGIFHLLEAHREQLAVELEYADTLCEYWTAEAELSALLAGVVVAKED